jgi:hypothetical protein
LHYLNASNGELQIPVQYEHTDVFILEALPIKITTDLLGMEGKLPNEEKSQKDTAIRERESPTQNAVRKA